MTFGVVEEATIASAGDNRAYSNGGYKKDECSNDERSGAECRDSF